MDLLILIVVAVIVIALMDLGYLSLFKKFENMPNCKVCLGEENISLANQWNYRVIKDIDKNTKQYVYAVHSVYYDRKGQPASWSEEPVDLYGNTKDELKVDMEMYLTALEKPVLLVQGDKLITVEWVS